MHDTINEVATLRPLQPLFSEFLSCFTTMCYILMAYLQGDNLFADERAPSNCPPGGIALRGAFHCLGAQSWMGHVKIVENSVWTGP